MRGLLLVAVVLLSGCAGFGEQDWWQGLEPASPCYEVDLLDGLDEADTTELHALFDCANKQGHLSALVPLDLSFDTLTRDGDPVGVQLARLINAMPALDVDPFALVGLALDALRAEDRPIDELLNLVLESIYGQPAERVRAEGYDLTSADQLDAGLLVPLGTLAPIAAGAMLDDDLRAADWAADVLGSPETKRWIRTFGAWSQATHPDVAVPIGRLLPELGGLIAATQSPLNDRWLGASGDSLRDLAVVFTSGSPPPIQQIGPEMSAMLADRSVRDDLEAELLDLHSDGTLEGALADARWLASVDVPNGGPLSVGEDSALYRFVRLLADTNQTTHCEFDLILFSVGVYDGNMAVDILNVMADMDPKTVDSGVGVLSFFLGNSISDWVLEQTANSGVCPVITQQVVQDLGAIDVIAQPQAEDLLTSFVRVLHVAKHGESNHIPQVANVAEKLFDAGALHPIEELLRDIGDEPATADLMRLVPVFSQPQVYGLVAGDEPAVNLQDTLDLLATVWDGGPNGTPAWLRMKPLVLPLVDHDASWALLHHAGGLLADDRSQLSHLLELVPTVLSFDPDLTLVDQLGPLLSERSLTEPALRMVEAEGVANSVLSSTPQGDDPEVPLAFGARLVVDGTLDDLLQILDLLLDTLGV